MPEAVTDQNPQNSDFRGNLQIARRHLLHFMVPFFAVWVLVWGSSWLIPPRFKSSTLILVQEPSMPQNYVAPNISDDMQARLESITQQILSRTRLLLIIDKDHLYEPLHGASTPDRKVEQMRKDITVELVRDPQRGNISAFNISYLAREPSTAQKVTGELTNLFINENNRVRQQQSEGTTSFLEQQLNEARASLSAQEAKVREFESQHIGALPTQQASNLQILAGLQAQLQSEQGALNTAKQQSAYLQAMVETDRKGRAAVSSSGGQSTSPSDLVSIDQQLEKLRAQLADLTSRYTDRYPDVQNTKTQIAKLESARARAAADPSPKISDASDSLIAADAASRQLQSQLHATQVEISNRENSVSDLKSRIAEYQGRLNAVPATEQQLAELTRGYEQSKANYDELLKKRDESQMATSMEEMQQGERFIMLDPPSLPIKPYFPNHLIFCGIGVGVAFVIGFLVAAAFEILDDRIYTEDEIKALLPMVVLSEIPEIKGPAAEHETRRRATFEWFATAAVLMIILAGALFSYVRG